MNNVEKLKIRSFVVAPDLDLSKQNFNFDQLKTVAEILNIMSIRAQELWKRAALGQELNGLPFRINGTTYPSSIQVQKINDFKYEIFSDYMTKTGHNLTHLLEKGHGPIDLKNGLTKGAKSKRSKEYTDSKGVHHPAGRYNIVSFRHGTTETAKNTMNPNILKDFKRQLNQAIKENRPAYSKIDTTNTGITKVNWGMRYKPYNTNVERYKYKSGKVRDFKNKHYQKMVVMDVGTGKMKRGEYLTFRVVSTRSPKNKWIVPEQKPWPVRKVVTDIIKPELDEMITKSLEADILG